MPKNLSWKPGWLRKEQAAGSPRRFLKACGRWLSPLTKWSVLPDSRSPECTLMSSFQALRSTGRLAGDPDQDLASKYRGAIRRPGLQERRGRKACGRARGQPAGHAESSRTPCSSKPTEHHLVALRNPLNRAVRKTHGVAQEQLFYAGASACDWRPAALLWPRGVGCSENPAQIQMST